MQFRTFKCNKIDESCRLHKTSQQPIEVMRLGAIEESVQNIKSGCIRPMLYKVFVQWLLLMSLAKRLQKIWFVVEGWGSLSVDMLPGTASVQGLFESRLARFHFTVMFFYAYLFIGACERLIIG